MNSTGLWCFAEPDLNLSLSNEFKATKVKNFMHQFVLTDKNINYLKILFDNEIDEGLNTDKTSNPANLSKMAMDVTYFTELFDGTEKGEFVLINLTAQNLILVLATIEPGFPVKTIRKYFTIDENVRSSPYIKIFEYLCDCLLIFFTENDLLNKLQTLGFSTDLPMIQFDIDKSIINYFTTTASDIPLNFYDIRKCFEIVLLKERYKDIQFDLVAVLNNNMSLLIYYSYLYGSIDIFINLEDDCDLIYQEKIANAKKWKSVHSERTQVYIDTGLRNFGRTGTLNFMTTDLDWSVISKSLSCTYADTECRLEKFMTEKYILELIRHILTTLHHELLYCREGDIGDLYKIHGVSLTDVITLTKVKDLNHVSQLLPAGTIGMSKDDAVIAKYVCSIVLIRSALLLSICLSQILKKIEKEDFVIAIKSPLLEKHPNYETYIRNYMEILAPKKKFQIIKLKDNASVEGAALATSIISRQRKETS